jgi:hypothetical protein
VTSSAMLTLNAPHSGPFAGLAIIQDSNGLPLARPTPQATARLAARRGRRSTGLSISPTHQ